MKNFLVHILVFIIAAFYIDTFYLQKKQELEKPTKPTTDTCKKQFNY